MLETLLKLMGSFDQRDSGAFSVISAQLVGLVGLCRLAMLTDLMFTAE